jgi:hypothetical protein
MWTSNVANEFSFSLVANNPDLLSRPVSFVNFSLQSTDSKTHNVHLLISASADLARNTNKQEVMINSYRSANLQLIRAGTKEQPMLKKKGDDLRIDWGQCYMALKYDSLDELNTPIASPDKIEDLNTILDKGQLSAKKTVTGGKDVAMNIQIQFKDLKKQKQERFMLLGYDDFYSIQYFGQNLQPWWKKNFASMEELLEKSAMEYASIKAECDAFDKKMYDDAIMAGGETYAKLCVLAYRQSLAAHKLVRGPNDELLFPQKENFSNGSIWTVDVTYPSAPLTLIYNPELLKGMTDPLFITVKVVNGPSPFLLMIWEPILLPMDKLIPKTCPLKRQAT